MRSKEVKANIDRAEAIARILSEQLPDGYRLKKEDELHWVVILESANEYVGGFCYDEGWMRLDVDLQATGRPGGSTLFPYKQEAIVARLAIEYAMHETRNMVKVAA